MPFRAKLPHAEPVAVPSRDCAARWGELVRVLASVGARMREAEKVNGAPPRPADAPPTQLQPMEVILK